MASLFKRLFAKPSASTDEVTRVAQTLWSWGVGEKATLNPSELVRRRGVQVFDPMRRDDQVRACMRFKKHAILATGWTVQSPPDQPDDWEVTEFVRYVLSSLVGTLDQDLFEILTALDYGYSVSEKIHAPIEQGPFAGKVGLREIKTRAPHDFTFAIDEHGNLSDVIQTVGLDRIVVPREKIILYAFDSEFSNPYGRSELEAAYRAWFAKENAYKWMAMYLERFGIPPLFALYDPNLFSEAQQNTLKTFLKRLQAATTGIIPRAGKDSLELWTPDQTTSINDAFIPAIEMYNKDISRALLMPNLLGFTSDGQAGSYARSQTQFDAFMMAVDQIRSSDITDGIMAEQVIKPLVELNYPGITDYPRFQFNPATSADRFAMLEAWTKLVAGNVVERREQDEAHVRALLGFPDAAEDGSDTVESDETEQSPLEKVADAQEQPAQANLAVKLTTRYEREADLKAAVAELNDAEAKGLSDVVGALRESVATMVGTIRSGYEMDAVELMRTIEVPKSKAIDDAILNMLTGAFDLGRGHINSETRGKANYKQDAVKSVGVAPAAAIKWLKANAVAVSSALKNDINKKVKKALLTAIRTGDTAAEAAARVKSVLDRYVGDETALRGGEEITPSHAETIARTNIIQAYNHGRVIQGRSNPLVTAFQYSAILDQRTTEVCQFLHGKLFKASDSAIDELQPPNHFNCRSVMVPVLIDQQPDESEFITSGDVGHAKDLAGDGFV